MNATILLSHLVAAAAVAPVPELGLVLQLGSAGAAIGAATALRAKRRWPGVDTWRITTAWATLGVVVGLVVVTGETIAAGS